MSFTSMMDQKATVTRRTTTRDVMGGEVETTTTIYTDVPCRVDAMSAGQRAAARERDMSGSVGVEVTHTIFCGPGYTFEDTDELTISGLVYQVITAHDLHGHHIEIEAKQRRPDR